MKSLHLVVFHNLTLALNPNVRSLTTYMHNPSFCKLLFGVIFLCQHFWGFGGGRKNVDGRPGINSSVQYHFLLAISSFRQGRGLGFCLWTAHYQNRSRHLFKICLSFCMRFLQVWLFSKNTWILLIKNMFLLILLSQRHGVWGNLF